MGRYQAWAPRFTPANAKQAVLAFNGDVYDGLSAKTLTEAEIEAVSAKIVEKVTKATGGTLRS